VAGVVALAAKAGGGRARHSHGHVVRRGRTVTVHTAPNNARTVARRRRIAADHEAGHVAVGRARRWKVVGASINDDGSGVTEFRSCGGRRYDPRDDIAVSLAGGMAAGTQAGCGSDNAYAEAARDSYPADQRGAAWREGERRARAALFWRGGERRRDSQRLQREGSL